MSFPLLPAVVEAVVEVAAEVEAGRQLTDLQPYRDSHERQNRTDHVDAEHPTRHPSLAR